MERNTRVRASQIRSILPIDVESTNARVDGYVPTYNESEEKFTWVAPGGGSADEITVAVLGTPTYDDVQDVINTTGSSGKISGGGFTDNLNGSITVAAGTGMIRESDSAVAELNFFDWAEDATVSLTDERTNYITVDDEGNISSTVTKSDCNNRACILLGKVFREGTVLHFVEAGMLINEATKNTLGYFTQVFGETVRASGFVISESGERYLSSTNGVIWAGLTRLTTTGIDTADSGVTFESYYYDGDLSGGQWIESDDTQLDNVYYNDTDTGLVELTANRYAVHWIYGCPDGDIIVVYGQGDYTLAGASAAQPPSTLPEHVSDFGFLAAKAIIQKSGTNILQLLSAYDTAFTPSGAQDHNELSSLQGGTADEYFHLTSSEHVELTGWLDNVILNTDGSVNLGTGTLTVNSIEIVGADGEVNAAAIEDKFLRNDGADSTSGIVTMDSLKINDSNDSHTLNIKWNEDDSGDRVLNLLVCGADRSLTLNESLTIGDGYDGTLTFSVSSKTLTVEADSIVNQDLTSDASPTFAGLTLVNAITEFSTDGTLSGDSDSAVPTEKAVKTYADNNIKGLYSTSFDDDDLAAGILTVNHALATQWQVVSIYDNNDKLIVPDEITLTDTNNVSVDLSSYGTISGTWHVIVVGVGGLSTVQTLIQDGDGDTKIQTEESTDEDIIRFDLGDATLTAAREVLTIQAIDANDVKIEPTTDNDVDLGSEAKGFRNLYATGLISAKGGQLKFPATQNPSADPNTLDDYEEGTYAATMTCVTSGTITVNSTYNKCSYVKIGNLVTVHGYLHVDSVSSPVGFCRISLPFVCKATVYGAEEYSIGAVLLHGADYVATGGVVAQVTGGVSYFELDGYSDSGASNRELSDIWSAGDKLVFTITYETN